MAERLVFRHTVEGLFTVAFRDTIDRDLRRKLAEAGLDLDKIPQALPAPIYGAAFEVLREHVYPGRDPEAAGREMGVRFLDGYFSTVMGSVVKTILRFLPIEKVIERTSSNLASGANFIEAKVRPLGPSLWEVWMSDFSTSPAFLAGVIQRMVELAGGQNVKLELVKHDERQLTFRVAWN